MLKPLLKWMTIVLKLFISTVHRLSIGHTMEMIFPKHSKDFKNHIRDISELEIIRKQILLANI